MLKIRDDVDLKELEKFGFEYHENKRNPSNSLYEWNDKMIEIKGSNEQIYIRTFDRRELVVNSDCGIAMGKLYDLIKANLVIKE
jgi:hypothetical protein|nr:MAG TPA: hypothetical protein [Caudoviricetes sp.]